MIYLASFVAGLVLLAWAPFLVRRYLEPGMTPRGLIRINLALLTAMLLAVLSLLVFLFLFVLPHRLMGEVGVGCVHADLCLHGLPVWAQSVVWLLAAGLLGGLLWRIARTMVSTLVSSRRVRRLVMAQRFCREESAICPVYEIAEHGVLACTIGFLRPLILVSGGLRRALSGEEFAVVLAHEQAHARGRDNLILLAARTMEKSLFFLPGARVASRGIHAAVELAADGYAVRQTGDPLLVASSLTNVAGLILESTRKVDSPFRSPAVASLTDGELTKRVRLLIADGHNQSSRPWLAGAVVVVLALLLVLVATSIYGVAGHGLATDASSAGCIETAATGSPLPQPATRRAVA